MNEKIVEYTFQPPRVGDKLSRKSFCDHLQNDGLAPEDQRHAGHGNEVRKGSANLL